jgi:hypothetical protein
MQLAAFVYFLQKSMESLLHAHFLQCVLAKK